MVKKIASACFWMLDKNSKKKKSGKIICSIIIYLLVEVLIMVVMLGVLKDKYQDLCSILWFIGLCLLAS